MAETLVCDEYERHAFISEAEGGGKEAEEAGVGSAAVSICQDMAT